MLTRHPFPIARAFLAGAPTDLIADSIALGDRWAVDRPAARRSPVEVVLSRYSHSRDLGLMAFWLGTAVEP